LNPAGASNPPRISDLERQVAEGSRRPFRGVEKSLSGHVESAGAIHGQNGGGHLSPQRFQVVGKGTEFGLQRGPQGREG
jgi:hypothetical protein